MEKKTLSFTQAMLDFFGKNGKSTQDFMAEMKALTTKDREELKELLQAYYVIV